MKKIKIKVFDAYIEAKDEKYYKDLGLEGFDIFEYHNQIVNKKGLVFPKKEWKKSLKPIKPLPQNIVEKDKYELDEEEKLTYKMFKDSTKKAKDIYESCKRKEEKYKSILLSKIDTDEEIYGGEDWDCNLSPIGKCLYHFDGNEYSCIFCGESEERK